MWVIDSSLVKIYLKFGHIRVCIKINFEDFSDSTRCRVVRNNQTTAVLCQIYLGGRNRPGPFLGAWPFFTLNIE